MDGYYRLYSRCAETWGVPAQVRQAAEECIELALACHHYLRNNRPDNVSEILEEIADVELMIGQLKYMLKIEDFEVECCKAAKEERLHTMLNAVDSGRIRKVE